MFRSRKWNWFFYLIFQLLSFFFSFSFRTWHDILLFLCDIIFICRQNKCIHFFSIDFYSRRLSNRFTRGRFSFFICFVTHCIFSGQPILFIFTSNNNSAFQSTFQIIIIQLLLKVVDFFYPRFYC